MQPASQRRCQAGVCTEGAASTQASHTLDHQEEGSHPHAFRCFVHGTCSQLGPWYLHELGTQGCIVLYCCAYDTRAELQLIDFRLSSERTHSNMEFFLLSYLELRLPIISSEHAVNKKEVQFLFFTRH